MPLIYQGNRSDKVCTLIYTYCNITNLNTVEKREGRCTLYYIVKNNFAMTVATKWKLRLIAKCLIQGVSQKTKVKSILAKLSNTNSNIEECGLKACSEDIEILTNTQRLLSSYQLVIILYIQH